MPFSTSPVRQKRGHTTLALLATAALFAAPAAAEEGMWTFDNPPLHQLAETYGFEPNTAWLDHLRLASVRFMDGGSGSFVSADGLMITNHHVGLGCIHNVSTEQDDYVTKGFLAASREDELACPGYEVNVLVSTEDVSARVLGAAAKAQSDDEARKARQAETARIETACQAETGLRCDVVSLYQGGEYWLYRYDKYTDVRLVFAPEEQMASFGGDPDNFTFPRHDLDICFMRAYRDGRPVQPRAHLSWSTVGVKAGDLVFISGNPGSTSRLRTVAYLEYLRDHALPFHIQRLRRRLEVLRAYAARGQEQDRRAVEEIRIYENSIKAWEGGLTALHDEPAMARKAALELELRRAAAEIAPGEPDPFETIARIRAAMAPRAAELRLVNYAFGGRLLAIAGEIVQYVAEVAKPNAQRYPEFVDAKLDSLRNELFSSAPIYKDLEVAVLTDELALAQETLGPEQAFVLVALRGESPAERARELVEGTSLGSPDARRRLIEGGTAAVEASTDPMIVLARQVDPLVREVRRYQEEDIEAGETRAAEAIARIRWKVHGRSVAPDATFTLRLAYGTVAGYPAEGTQFAPLTTFYGLFDRSLSHGGETPWDLTPRWHDASGRIDLGTFLNFVSTVDSTGGNSGSPMVDRAGEFVGIAFDGNIQTLAWPYFYTDRQARSVAVDARGIIEALEKVYDARSVVEELRRPWPLGRVGSPPASAGTSGSGGARSGGAGTGPP